MLILIQSKNAKYCLAEYIEQNDAEKKQIIGYSFNKNIKRTFIKKNMVFLITTFYYYID